MSKSLLTQSAVNEMCRRACFCLWPKIGWSYLWLCLTCNYERPKLLYSLIMESEQIIGWKKYADLCTSAWRWRIKSVRDTLTWPVHVWACFLRSTSWHVEKHNPSANLRLEWGGASEMSWKETHRCQWFWMNTNVLCWATNACVGFASLEQSLLQ